MFGKPGWPNQVIPQPHNVVTPFQQPYMGQVCRATDQTVNLVKKLTVASLAERTDALHTLSVMREQIPNLAIYLWESPATITSLLSEILAIYPHLAATSTGSSSTPPSLNSRLANRVCNVLALFQCVAGHDDTRMAFIRADIPMYLFPFLHTTNTSRECECFKLTSLGIIGSLVKAEQPEIIEYLLQKEFVPLCLRILKFGQEMSRIVAAFIIQRILNDRNGLKNVCQSTEKVETVIKVLNLVLTHLATNFNQRLAKNVLQSYECLLNAKEGREVAAKADLEKLRQVTQISSKCEESFLEFVNNLLAMNVGPGTKA